MLFDDLMGPLAAS